MRRLMPPFWFLAALILMIVMHRFAPIRQIVSGPWRWLGVLPLLAGLLLGIRSARIFEQTGTTIKPFQTSSTLVVRGPFRLSRNPMYLGMVAVLLGAAILAGSLAPFLVVPAFAVFLDRRFIQAEERILESTFGPPYAVYKASVRRWL